MHFIAIPEHLQNVKNQLLGRYFIPWRINSTYFQRRSCSNYSNYSNFLSPQKFVRNKSHYGGVKIFVIKQHIFLWLIWNFLVTEVCLTICMSWSTCVCLTIINQIRFIHNDAIRITKSLVYVDLRNNQINQINCSFLNLLYRNRTFGDDDWLQYGFLNNDGLKELSEISDSMTCKKKIMCPVHHNRCPEQCTARYKKPLGYILIFDCTYKNLTELPQVFTSKSEILMWNLTGSSLTRLPLKTDFG